MIRSKICEQVIPTDIRVFYENEKPYVYYKGKMISESGEWEIEIPKMSMVLNTLERIIDTNDVTNASGNIMYRIPVCNQFFAAHDVAYTLRSIKRKMTKSQIERSLGYSIDIVGE